FHPNHIEAFSRYGKQRRILKVNDKSCVSVIVCPSMRNRNGTLRWDLYTEPYESKYVTLLCGLSAANDRVQRLQLVPPLGSSRRIHYRLGDHSPLMNQGVRLKSLKDFYDAWEELEMKKCNSLCSGTKDALNFS